MLKFKHLYKFRDTDTYKIVFYFFHLCAVFKGFQIKYNGKNQFASYFLSNVSNILFNILILIWVLIIILTGYFCGNRNTKADFVFIFICLLHFINRCYLCEKIKKFLSLSKKVQTIMRSVPHSTESPAWITIWSSLSFCTCLILLVLMFREAFQGMCFKSFLLEYVIKENYFKSILIVSYLVSSFIILYMPIQVLTLYYVKICWDIRKAVCGFHALVKRFPVKNYDNLSDIYCKIQFTVNSVDSLVGIPVFFSFTCNALMMYYGVVIILHSSENSLSQYSAIVYLSCLLSFGNFLAQTVTAALVSEAFKQLRSYTKKMTEFDTKYKKSLKRLLQVTDEKIVMTVWGFVSMKRSTIFGTLGAILTYSLIIDGIYNNKN